MSNVALNLECRAEFAESFFHQDWPQSLSVPLAQFKPGTPVTISCFA